MNLYCIIITSEHSVSISIAVNNLFDALVLTFPPENFVHRYDITMNDGCLVLKHWFLTLIELKIHYQNFNHYISDIYRKVPAGNKVSHKENVYTYENSYLEICFNEKCMSFNNRRKYEKPIIFSLEPVKRTCPIGP
jgi:hypothetical protein